MERPADPVAALHAEVSAAASVLKGSEVDLPGLERPPKAEFGDYSTNAAMLLAPSAGEPPREVAEQLGEKLSATLGTALERVEVAGPGFLNLFMSDEWVRASLASLLGAGEDFGSGVAPSPGRMLVEFVSANPTGPITVAAARHAAFGDSLCRILAFAGHEVDSEYYVNDYGNQVRLFGESIKARARGEEPPEDGYLGAYVAELAARIPDAAEADPDELALKGIEIILEGVKATLGRFRVVHDSFFSERSLHESGAVEAGIRQLEQGQHVYPADDAVWFRTTALGDDKDRVLMRGSGELTYFASDVAYHENKRARGYDAVLNVLGADHHGYTARVRAAWQALGGAPEAIDFVIMQLVSLSEGGERVQMSKRRGELITLDDLLDDIGVDAARYFLLQRSHDTTLDIDLDLARSQSQENPVYYVQYAHARIKSILRKAGEAAVERALAADLAGGSAPIHPSERLLVKKLLEFPEEIVTAAERRAPHRLTTYAHETAQDFSAFYRDCKVVGAAEEGGDEDFRLALCIQTAALISRSLDLLGVEAPEEMHSEPEDG